MQGRVAEALPKVEEKLKRVQAWWQQHRAGLTVPEAPESEALARMLITTFDVANEAHRAQNGWEAALGRTDAMLEVMRLLQRSADDIAAAQVNRAVELGQLGRYGEAKADLEACLKVLQNDPDTRAKVFSSLASLLNTQGDVSQAITQERRALALRAQLPNPQDRAGSHHNLASYLLRSGIPSALAEFPHHQLAGLVYQLVSGLGQDLQTSLGNYVINFCRAHAASTTLAVPRLAELLADPAFRPLDDWLHKRAVDVAEVQADVDKFLEQAQKKAMEDG
jgi:tetratricopeptide (TPR) repeat protein